MKEWKIDFVEDAKNGLDTTISSDIARDINVRQDMTIPARQYSQMVIKWAMNINYVKI